MNSKFSWDKLEKHFLAMAPMAGITNSPFRRVAKKLGADVVFSEMVAADALHYKSQKTIHLMKFQEEERPFIIQIFGSELKKMAFAAKFIENKVKPDGIDINMGCPAKKVVGSGKGSALLLDFKLAAEIAKSVRESTKLPVSVKMRIGWETFEISELTTALEKVGIDALSIHGRTKKQGFSRKPDLKAIKEIKKTVKIPVIGNGGIKTIADFKHMITQTDCDGTMIGRGALGNPWVFKSIKSNQEYEPNWEELVETVMWQTEMSIQEFGEKRGILEMRKFYGWYFRGFDGASKLRKKLIQTETLNQVEKILNIKSTAK